MMIIRYIFSLFCLLVWNCSFAMTPAQTASYEYACAMYPDLKSMDTPMKKKYDQVYERMVLGDHSLLKNPDYPLIIANRLASTMFVRKKTISKKDYVYQKYIELMRKENFRIFFGSNPDKEAILLSWNKACKTYPHILRANNAHRKRIQAAYANLRSSNNQFLKDMDWPSKLAHMTFQNELAVGIKKVLVGKDGLVYSERKQENVLRGYASEMNVPLSSRPLKVDERVLIFEKAESVRQLRDIENKKIWGENNRMKIKNEMDEKERKIFEIKNKINEDKMSEEEKIRLKNELRDLEFKKMELERKFDEEEENIKILDQEKKKVIARMKIDAHDLKMELDNEDQWEKDRKEINRLNLELIKSIK